MIVEDETASQAINWMEDSQLLILNDKSHTDHFINAITQTKRDCTVIDTLLVLIKDKLEEVAKAEREVEELRQQVEAIAQME